MKYFGEGRSVEYVVVHHTEGLFGSLDFFNRIHQERGFPVSRSGNYCGYHVIILNGYKDYEDLDQKKYRKDLDGKLVPCRDEDEMGAHVHGLNSRSLGIALVGNFNHLIPSIFQLTSLFEQVLKWTKDFKVPVENIIGHHEAQGLQGKSYVPADRRKTCPGEDLDMCWIRDQIHRML